jgi:ribokinase
MSTIIEAPKTKCYNYHEQMNSISIIVIGALNTDITVLGADKLLGPGEYTHAQKLEIGPGGKSRNIAQMIAALTQKKIAMIGITAKDPYSFWKVPLNALKKAGVNCDYVKITSSGKYPGIAVIPVDKQGKNQIYVIPGVSNNFSPSDIDDADGVFRQVKKNSGFLVMSLELPLSTGIHAIKKANKLGIKILLDPGGIDEHEDYQKLLKNDIYLLKPNIHEAKILTGIPVTDFSSAQKAARKLLAQGVKNVFITVGEKGAYFFNNTIQEHIPVPDLHIKNSATNETGSGDQAIAAFAFALLEGYDLLKAAKIAVLTGTLQFHTPGITPVTKSQLLKFHSLI